MSVVSESKSITENFLHDKYSIERELCMGDCFVRMIKSDDESDIERYFEELPFLDVECTVHVMNFLWREISRNEPVRLYSEFQKPKEKVSWVIAKSIRGGLIESCIKLCSRYLKIAKSSHPEDHDFMKSNQNVNHVYYSLFILSSCNMYNEHHSRWFYKNEDELFNIVCEYLNMGMTWLEVRITCRLLQSLICYLGVSNPRYHSFIRRFLCPQIVSKVFFWIENGYERLYLDFIQIRNKRVEYQVSMIQRSTIGDQFSQSEDRYQDRIWFTGFSWIRWCATFLMNSFGYEEKCGDNNGKKLVSILDQSGFFKRFYRLMETQQDDDVDEYLIEILMKINKNPYGREIFMKKRNEPKLNFLLISDLALTFAFRGKMVILLIRFLKDDRYWERMISYCAKCFPYLLVCTYPFRNDHSEIYLNGKYENRSIGLTLCKYLKKRSSEIMRRNFECSSKKKKYLPFVFLNFMKNHESTMNERDKCSNIVWGGGRSPPQEHLQRVRREVQKLANGEIKNENELVYNQNITYFCEMKMKNLKNQRKLNHYESYLLSFSHYYHLVWSRATSKRSSLQSQYAKLMELSFLKDMYEQTKHLLIRNDGNIWEDSYKMEKYVNVQKYRMREIRLFKKFGKPSHLTRFFKRNFDVEKYPECPTFGKNLKKIKEREENVRRIWNYDDDAGFFDFGEESDQKKCNFCRKRKKNLKRCARCKKVLYCGMECQKKDWKRHKLECIVGK